jgi:hypothetical protein
MKEDLSTIQGLAAAGEGIACLKRRREEPVPMVLKRGAPPIVTIVCLPGMAECVHAIIQNFNGQILSMTV